MWKDCFLLNLPTDGKPKIGMVFENLSGVNVWTHRHETLDVCNTLPEFVNTTAYYTYIYNECIVDINDWCVIGGEVKRSTVCGYGMKIILSNNPALMLHTIPSSIIQQHKVVNYPVFALVKFNDVSITQSTECYDDDVLCVNGEPIMSYTHSQPDVLIKESKKYEDVYVNSDDTVDIAFIRTSFNGEEFYEKMRRMAIYFKAIGGNEKDNCWLSHHNEMFDIYIMNL